MSRGYFITFEGLDGSGKSTQLRLLARGLVRRGESVIVTRQPGGTELGDRIRALLLDSKTRDIDPIAEMTLMFADRAQAIAENIRPALSAGGIVLCDRFTDSTEAYQGGGRELGSERVLALDRAICGGLRPDLTLLLMPNMGRSLFRARRRNLRTEEGANGCDESRFEGETAAFYERVYRKYEEIADREPERVVALRKEESIRAIHRRILKIVEERLPK